MREFVRYDLRHVVDVLRRFRPGIDLAGGPRRYVLDNQSLVAQDDVIGDAALRTSILARHGRLLHVELPFSANRITIRSHARIFGLNGDGSVTAKVALRKATPGESFFHEVRARGMAARFLAGTTVAIPEIRRKDPAKGWIVEAFVAGSSARPEDMADFLVVAERFYRPTTRVRPVARTDRNRWFLAQVSAILAETAPRRAMVEEDDGWLNCLCHGDLGTHNFMRGEDGRLWILDWERARFLPLGLELGRLYIEHPSLKPQILGLIGSLSPPAGVLPPVEQLVLGAAFALKWREFVRDMTIGESIRLHGIHPDAAAAEYDRRTTESRQFIAELAG